MMNFQTKVDIPEPGFNIDFKDKMLFLGSCFSDNIGSRLLNLKFPVIHNPFGVLYNPASIVKSLQRLRKVENFTENELNYYNELWYSFYHHTSFSNSNKTDCLTNINEVYQSTCAHLKNSSYLFVNLGTARVYHWLKTGEVVSNCHKIPAKEFKHSLLTVEEIVGILTKEITELLEVNHDLKIIFSVSPIRHWKDGAVENQRSKASLILAISELEKAYSNSVYYFPVYEIFMDELRDYRFYDSDMLHPGAVGIEYVWEKFTTTFFNQETSEFVKESDAILKSLNHRVSNQNTEAFKKFKESLRRKVLNFNEKYKGEFFVV